MRAALRLTAALLLVGPGDAGAQLKPNADWRQLATSHFNIIYEAGLDSIARHAAERAELEHARLSKRLGRAPSGRIDLMLANNTDITNGFATPLPSNRVVIWVRPPVDELGIQHYDDWIDLAIAHELTHTFHIDQAGAVGRLLRSIFGRVPFAWPVFPLIGVPRWNTEGLATVIESEHTGVGRVYDSFHEMVVRTTVLEDAFPTIDRVSGESPAWPGGTRAYIYGSLFMDYIARRYGERAHAGLVGETKGSVLPPPWRFDGIAKEALGRSFRDLYQDWQVQLARKYEALADSLRALGITAGERMTTHGRWAVYPRISPDRRRLAYAQENGRDIIATRIIDLSSGTDARIRRNGIGPLAWLPDNAGFVTAQYEYRGRYELYTDLYLVRAGTETRLTSGARAEMPDVSYDGARIVYVQNVSGSNRLIVRDFADGVERVLAETSPDVHWTLPRFSPDGTRIAAQRWTRGRGHDIAVLSEDGRSVAEIRTEGIDAAPAWSADGRYVIFSSDRTGITNLYAFDAATADLLQVTNVLTGVFYPEVSRDGAWIYYSAYHADGFHIARIPYDPATWRAPMPVASPLGVRGDTVRIEPMPPAIPLRVSDAGTYSALRSALPRYWLPLAWRDTAIGTFVGVQTSGADDIGRHAYAAGVAHDFDHGRVAGYLSYSYAGLGNPVLTLTALRDWDNTGRVALRDSLGELVGVLGSYEREDRITLTAELANRRWRSSSSLVLGAEGVAFSRATLGAARFADPEDRFLGVLAGVGFANAVTPALAIGPEDGVRASVFVRRRFELDPAATDRSYTELSGSGAAYKSTGGSRFAHETLALRASALQRTQGRGPTDVGGVADFLPVRGFSSRARVGFTAWTAALEYRMPLGLIARGYRLRPFFVDRIAAAFFVDAGNASCNREQREVYLSCAGAGENPREALVSAGFELRANAAVLVFAPTWWRTGIAFPIRGGARDAQIYLTIEPSF